MVSTEFLLEDTMTGEPSRNASKICLAWWACSFLAVNVTLAQARPFTSRFPIEQCHFSAFGGNAYFVLNPGHQLILSGEEDGSVVDLTITVLDELRRISLPTANGARSIATRVIEEREIIDGELTEVARHFYARCIETSDVYYFGEEASLYEAGEIVSTVGSWEAGTSGAVPGILMPGTFMLGARYLHQQAPGAIMDMAENFESEMTIETAIGRLENCVRVLEFDGFKPETEPSIKTYAPGIGIINDDDILLLQELHAGKAGVPSGCNFIPFSDNPFLPFAPGMRFEFDGNGDQSGTTMTISVLDETRAISLGSNEQSRVIQARVIESTTTRNDELIQVSRDLLAECIETGDVYVFGREFENYENAEMVSTEGSWIAGVGDASPGIEMPNLINRGLQFSKGDAPAVFSSRASITGTEVSTTVPAGSFEGCVDVFETLNTAQTVTLTYAPGIGVISIDETFGLSSYAFGEFEQELPLLSVQDSVTLSWPLHDTRFGVESSNNLNDWTSVSENASAQDGRYKLSLPRNTVKTFFRLSESPDAD